MITDFYGQFLETAQDTMSTTASSYDLWRLVQGILIAGIALVLALTSLGAIAWKSMSVAAFALMTILYAVMMFASSYVEEEQHFWYWCTAAWIACLSAQKYVHHPPDLPSQAE